MNTLQITKNISQKVDVVTFWTVLGYLLSGWAIVFAADDGSKERSVLHNGRNRNLAAPIVQDSVASPLDATYRIAGQDVTLHDGRSERAATSSSASKMLTKVYGEPVIADIDGDGDNDTILILVHDPGGSGTFYYLVAAININNGYQGTKAFLLGDRIVIRHYAMQHGAFEVVYLDRPPDTPMTSSPSVEKKLYLIFNMGELTVVQPDAFEFQPRTKARR